MSGFMVFGADDDNGGGDGAAAAAKAAADQAAAQAAADKLIADQAAAEAARKASGISDNEAKLLQEVMDKKTALKNAKDEIAQVKAQLSQFDGINLEEIKAVLKEREESANKELEAKGEWDRLKTNLLGQHDTEKATLQEKILALQTDLANKDGSIHGLTIGSAFSASRFIADELTLTPSKAQIVYGAHFEYQDGKIIGYDKPKGSAERTRLIGSDGEPLGFDLAVAKIIEADAEKDFLLRSKARPGAGSGTADGVVKPVVKPVSGTSRIAGALNS